MGQITLIIQANPRIRPSLQIHEDNRLPVPFMSQRSCVSLKPKASVQAVSLESRIDACEQEQDPRSCPQSVSDSMRVEKTPASPRSFSNVIFLIILGCGLAIWIGLGAYFLAIGNVERYFSWHLVSLFYTNCLAGNMRRTIMAPRAASSMGTLICGLGST